MGPLELLVLLILVAAPVAALLLLVRLVGRRLTARRPDTRPVATARAEDDRTASVGSAERRT